MQQIGLAQWAHDIRNALGTVALYVDTLERPTDPQSSNVVACTHALLAKAAAMCNAAVQQVSQTEHGVHRARFDVVATVAHMRDLIAPTLPASCSLQVVHSGPTYLKANAQDVFRILFNLLHNAATVARQSQALRRIWITIECSGATAMITVSDDGPGLPKSVRSTLFRPGRSMTGGTGYGLSIARELAERNGGCLRFADASNGTAFVIELPLDAASVDRVAMLYRSRGVLRPRVG